LASETNLVISHRLANIKVFNQSQSAREIMPQMHLHCASWSILLSRGIAACRLCNTRHEHPIGLHRSSFLERPSITPANPDFCHAAVDLQALQSMRVSMRGDTSHRIPC
jgi:hypothetical protein